MSTPPSSPSLGPPPDPMLSGGADAPNRRSGPDEVPALARQRVTAARVGRLATVSPAGLPRVVPCCFVLIEDRIYSAVDGKPKSTTALRRLADIRVSPAVCLLLDHYEEDWAELWWVRIDGRASVLEPGEESDQARAWLRAKYQQYAVVPLHGPVIRVDVDRWRWWP